MSRLFRRDLLLYALRKALMVIPLLIGVITLIFVLIEISPGSAVDQFINEDTTPEVRDRLMVQWQLDKPAYIRYLLMMKNVMMLDFGASMSQQRPVFDAILEFLPNTLLLSSITLLTIYPVGLVLGTLQGVRQGKPIDTGISLSSLFFYSMPSFWLALMLQLIFGRYLQLLPISGMHDAVSYEYMTNSEAFFDRLKYLVMPGVAMGVAHAAGVARYMRSSLLEVIRQDYIRTARAKGLPERVVIVRHAIRNALLPMVTLFGLSLPMVFSGSVLVEYTFAWPGMGRLIVEAIRSQDTPLLIACFFVFTLVVSFGSLATDLVYALIDPRIRFDK